MRASIIQLKQVVFQRILVEALEPSGDAVPDATTSFDFEGVAFRVSLDVNPAPVEGGQNPLNFVVSLAIAIDPEDGKPAPYMIDILALGLIEVAEQVETQKRRDLALVNGASLVYGAVRELVTTLTGRCIAGPLVLPTADFRDHSEWLPSPPAPDADIKPRRRRARTGKQAPPEQA